VGATISGSLRALRRIWRGDVSWSRALRDRSVCVVASLVRRPESTWIGTAAARPKHLHVRSLLEHHGLLPQRDKPLANS
jgi:hypothetical protein